MGAGGDELALELVAVAAAQGLEQDLLAHEVLGGDGGREGQAVGGRGQDEDLLIPQALHGQGLGGEGLLQDEGEVHGTFQHLALEVPHEARLELEADPGELRLEAPEDAGQQVGADGLGAREAEGADALLLLDRGLGLLGEGQDALGVHQEAGPGLRELQAVSHPVEQVRPQILFQALDLGGDAGLGITQGRSGVGEVQRPGSGAKGGEGSDIHEP